MPDAGLLLAQLQAPLGPNIRLDIDIVSPFLHQAGQAAIENRGDRVLEAFGASFDLDKLTTVTALDLAPNLPPSFAKLFAAIEAVAADVVEQPPLPQSTTP